MRNEGHGLVSEAIDLAENRRIGQDTLLEGRRQIDTMGDWISIDPKQTTDSPVIKMV